MTCAGCGLPLTDDTVQTDRGPMHRICAAIAVAQARQTEPICYKHGCDLDDTGWCPICRERVS